MFLKSLALLVISRGMNAILYYVFFYFGLVLLTNGKKMSVEFAKLGTITFLNFTIFDSFFFLQLMGNPSDGFYGKTISLSIQNFWAEVTIYESEKLILTPHPLCDPTEFGSLADLHDSYGRDGYLGGLRLLQATCRKFYQYCSKHGIALAKRNFTLKYDTNIPRQVRK